MTDTTQIDMFGSTEQGDLFGPAQEIDYRPDPDAVRAQLHTMLAEVRDSNVLPWKPAKAALYRTICPQMTNWLPSDEARQLCFEFENELARLEAA